jgi:D-alanine-D-alanine ligase
MVNKKKKLCVAVIFGGPSSEHEVSLNTGKNMVAALNRKKYSVLPVFISKKGAWSVRGKKTTPEKVLRNTAVVLNAMHGEFGEDGTVQGFLDTLGIAYTGSGQKASMTGMDKAFTKYLAAMGGVRVAPSVLITRGQKIVLPFLFPVVVKPNSRGSSVGVSIVKNKREFARALRETFKHDAVALVEQFIKGREITLGVLEQFRGKKLFPLPATEIIPGEASTFFDYTAKYVAGGAREITPAQISPNLTKKAQETAVQTFRAVGARHYARIDMIIDDKNNIWMLEINTLPGMTATSLLPQQAQYIGLSLEKLLEHLIQLAVRKKHP